MGMRYKDGAASPEAPGEAPDTPEAPGTAGAAGAAGRPPMVLVAAVVVAAEALALLVYTVLTVIAVATNQTYQVSSGVAQIVLQLIVVAGLTWIASGLAKVRPWTRTPAVMLQGFIGIMAIILLQAHRLDWGLATLVLAAAGLAGLLSPSSLRALARPMPSPQADEKPVKTASSGGGSKNSGGGAKNAGRSGNPGKSGNPAKRHPARKTAAKAAKPVSRRS